MFAEWIFIIMPTLIQSGFEITGFVVLLIENRHANSDVRLTGRYHGPAVQVDITERQTDVLLLSVDLVPCFEIENGQ